MTILSVLDQSPVQAGGTPETAILETVKLAQLADRLGYRRYWVAEHHASDGLAGASPEMLIGQIAARTETIKVGSGGVMLSHYSPLKVAESFRLLETFYPGRIDLGIGRAPGSDQRTAQALAYGQQPRGPDIYPNQVQDLIALLGDGLPADHPFAGIHASPQMSRRPELWMLGSSDQSAQLAAHFGVPYSFAHFITDESGPAMMRSYQMRFQPSELLAEPQGSIGVFVICADTEEEAQRLGASRDLWRVRLDMGQIGPVPTVEEALAYEYSDIELQRRDYHRRRNIVGAPEQVKRDLEEVLAKYRVDEAVVVTITHDYLARARSYELLAEVFKSDPENG
ncbi:MAG: LLM class flavin-dependent oxidoreductase [Alphaproteobacteria bacterium]|jgi:luciferase family oxidoreductase group 1|nr:LLM class flavin-dependent oxidoreductase [Alphaproteobacteria bacterium]MBT4965682.1 LLM class flavin-dependent oxidoreductase [Alphaproteobacteria bacterium]MBT5160215.1 LLM class flavin-dependent oxidoreductase [Alphaproteobacteria bacterium]MBT6385305.1 LLM class flavin-dependent oxidoreductase [Alphaproteobacteria bacterium]